MRRGELLERWCTLILSLALWEISAGVFYLFYSGDTIAFLAVGLPDPLSGQSRAAFLLGGLIAAVLLAALTWGNLLFVLRIWDNLACYSRVNRRWHDHWDSQGEVEVAQSRDEIVADLLQTAVPGTHIQRVLLSWSDASPYSDAETVLEGASSSTRQQLNVLKLIAAMLVLLGLIGNFFGLSEAVRELPDLIRKPRRIQQPAPLAAEAQPRPRALGEQVTKTTYSEPLPAPRAQIDHGEVALRSHLQVISGGLSVVVLSSVLGIVGMVVLSSWVGWIQKVLHSLLTREIALMSAHIGSALRVRADHSQATLKEVAAQLRRLPLPLQAQADQSQQLVQALTGQSQDFTILAAHLEATLSQNREVMQSLQVTHQGLVEQWQNTHQSTAQLATAAMAMVESSERLARRLQQLADKIVDSQNAYLDSQKKAVIAFDFVLAHTQETSNTVRTHVHQSCAALESLGGQVQTQICDGLSEVQRRFAWLAEHQASHFESAVLEIAQGQKVAWKEWTQQVLKATTSHLDAYQMGTDQLLQELAEARRAHP